MTDWHRVHQLSVARGFREVPRGVHRADVVSADGFVVELQHSRIAPEEIAEREQYYGRMLWVFDAREAFEDERLELRRWRADGTVTLRWKHARKSVATCERLVLLDIGYGAMLRLIAIYPGPPCGGLAALLRTADVWRWLAGGAAPRWLSQQEWYRLQRDIEVFHDKGCGCHRCRSNSRREVPPGRILDEERDEAMDGVLASKYPPAESATTTETTMTQCLVDRVYRQAMFGLWEWPYNAERAYFSFLTEKGNRT